MRITFTIPGKPFAKQRHRVGSFGGKARAYNTKANESFESVVQAHALPLFHEPIKGAVRLSIVAVFEPASSLSKTKRAALMHRPHIQRPDGDNIVKAIKDGLNRIAWADDCQVAEHSCRKAWGTTAQTIVTVEPMEWAGIEMSASIVGLTR